MTCSLGDCIAALSSPTRDARAVIDDLVGFVRQRRGDAPEGPAGRFGELLDAIEADPARLTALRGHVVALLATRQLVGFFADSGVLPATGFFTEFGRIATERLLPTLPDETDLRDVLRRIFHARSDAQWLQSLPAELSLRLWSLIAGAARSGPALQPGTQAQLLEAVLVLGYRVGGLDVATEFGTLGPEFAAFAPCFRGLAGATQRFVDSQGGAAPEDSRQLQVMAGQCTDVLLRALRTVPKRGSSLRMTYTLRRTEQCLQRLLDLALLIDAAHTPPPSLQTAPQADFLPRWTALVHGALLAESQRHRLTHHLSAGMAMLARSVTDNAAKTGEHYIADTRAAYFGMWRSAMGAGLIIGVMALLKVFIGAADGSLAGHALLYSLNYGLGFVVIYMLHLTVATKQPAMTAQTIAGYLGQARKGRVADLDRVVDLVVSVAHSQFAAIVGNVVVAVPTAIALFVAFAALFGQPPLDAGKGAAMLAELDIAGWALPYAAVAGVCLFLSGLLTGYFDNKASFDRIGERVANLAWLRRLVGEARAAGVGTYLDEHLGGLMGNFLFGCMLGTAGTVGVILGLPIDVRHVAFSSANLGYAWAAFGFSLPWQALAWGLLGVALIGLTNLLVSFMLALWMAMRARDIDRAELGELARRLWVRLRQSPASFFTVSGPQ